MPTRSGTSQSPEIQDYRHDDATRRNNPPAGIASHGGLREKPKQEYAYNPHLPPVLRFDDSGAADQIPELLEKAKNGLSDDEIKILADALKDRAPWLEWAGKQEAKSFAVDPVALHIHERLSAKAILRVAARQDVQRHLFADPQQAYHEAVQFYQHDVDWSNRLILGDSLTVMSSLAHREDLAGKVQMIYIDPPYGINFHSNFQPTVFQHDVKDKESDLTREQEQIKAYRDTWMLGVHSYLAYLRDRLIVAEELLTDSGSIFVQISDENVHRVRCLMDEVFGSENYVGLITYRTSTGMKQKKAPLRVNGFLVWYAKAKDGMKFRRLFIDSEINTRNFRMIEGKNGNRRPMTDFERSKPDSLDPSWRVYQTAPLHSKSGGDKTAREFAGKKWTIPAGSWRYSQEGFQRLGDAGRINKEKTVIRAIRYFDDFPLQELTVNWTDTGPELSKSYVVQTNPRVIQRCLLMTTGPGDLVLDPTCGSGTTAYVAEGWGRRWITIDTSRVAVALARQRLLTGNFNYYKLEDESKGVAGGFVNIPSRTFSSKTLAKTPRLTPSSQNMNQFSKTNWRR